MDTDDKMKKMIKVTFHTEVSVLNMAAISSVPFLVKCLTEPWMNRPLASEIPPSSCTLTAILLSHTVCRYSPKNPSLVSETVHYKRGVSQQFSMPSFKIDFNEWKEEDVSICSWWANQEFVTRSYITKTNKLQGRLLTSARIFSLKAELWPGPRSVPHGDPGCGRWRGR